MGVLRENRWVTFLSEESPFSVPSDSLLHPKKSINLGQNSGSYCSRLQGDRGLFRRGDPMKGGNQEGGKLPFLRTLVILAILVGGFYSAWKILGERWPFAPSAPGRMMREVEKIFSPIRSFLGDREDEIVEVGIAYGTEKDQWLKWAAQEFARTPQGKNIRINLIPLGSLEAAHAILAEDKRIHVWTPASSLYKEIFIQEWQLNHGNIPILREEVLALSLMVFVMWKERYEAFLTRYPAVTFRTLHDALRERTGWAGIASKPEWGVFKLAEDDF